jgi:hypothetical protein
MGRLRTNDERCIWCLASTRLNIHTILILHNINNIQLTGILERHLVTHYGCTCEWRGFLAWYRYMLGKVHFVCETKLADRRSVPFKKCFEVTIAVLDDGPYTTYWNMFGSEADTVLICQPHFSYNRP